MTIDYRIIKPKFKLENKKEIFSIPCYVKKYGKENFYFNRNQEIVKTREVEIERLDFKTGKIKNDIVTIYKATIKSFEQNQINPPYETDFILRLSRSNEIEKIIYTKTNVGLAEKLTSKEFPIEDRPFLQEVFYFNYDLLNNWLKENGFEDYN